MCSVMLRHRRSGFQEVSYDVFSQPPSSFELCGEVTGIETFWAQIKERRNELDKVVASDDGR